MDTKAFRVGRFAVLLYLMTPSTLRHQHGPTVLGEHSRATVAQAKRTSAPGMQSVYKGKPHQHHAHQGPHW